MSAQSAQTTFFRQSGWMVIAVTTSGIFMWAVHFPAMRRMPETEYAMFAALLQVLTLMLIPALALQTVFAKQAAAAITEEQRQQLTGTVRGLFVASTVFWMICSVIVFVFRTDILQSLKITNPAALWITMLTCLPMLWLPILEGVLQGSQNFLWLGWTNIFKGFGRFIGVLITVVLLGGYATAGIVAAFFGMMIAWGIGVWQTKEYWTGSALPIQWNPWLARVVPLTLGLGATYFMLAADMIFVQMNFEDGRAPYAAAGTIARGIVAFTGPLVMVMFPKIVRSAARSEDTNLLTQALGATALMGGGVALGCTLLPTVPFHVLKPEFLPIAPLLPWFAWCMWPLTLTNVLVGNLLARSKFAAVPWLVLVSATYGVTLALLRNHLNYEGSMQGFKQVVLTLGAFNLLLFLVALWFTWRSRPKRAFHAP